MGAITSSLVSSVALGLLQAISFAKEPLGHLEKTTPEAVISPCPVTPGLWSIRRWAHNCSYQTTPFVVTNVPKTCDTPQSSVPGIYSLTDHGFCSH